MWSEDDYLDEAFEKGFRMGRKDALDEAINVAWNAMVAGQDTSGVFEALRAIRTKEGKKND